MITNTLDCRGRLPFGGDVFGGGWGTLPGSGGLGDWGDASTPCGGGCGCTVSALPLSERLTLRAFTGEVVPLLVDTRSCNDTNGNGTGDPTKFYVDTCTTNAGIIQCTQNVYTPQMYTPHLSLMQGGLPLVRVSWDQVSRFFLDPSRYPSIWASIAPNQATAYQGTSPDGCCRLVYGVPSFGTYWGRSSPTSSGDVLVNIPFHFTTGNAPVGGYTRTRPKLCCFRSDCTPGLGSCAIKEIVIGGATYYAQDGTTDTVSFPGVTACAVLVITICPNGLYDIQFTYLAQVLVSRNFYRDPANECLYPAGVYQFGYTGSFGVSWTLRSHGTVAGGNWDAQGFESLVLQDTPFIGTEFGVQVANRFGPTSFDTLSQPFEWYTRMLEGCSFIVPCASAGLETIGTINYRHAACTQVQAKLEL